MQKVMHLCGQPLEHAIGPQAGYTQGGSTELRVCPRCGEGLADIDMRDVDGQLLALDRPSRWALHRRAVQVCLPSAGYALTFDRYWQIERLKNNTPILYTANLDQAIREAGALVAQQSLLRLFWPPVGDVQSWEGVLNISTGRAYRRAIEGTMETFGVVVDGERIEIQRDGSAPQVGRVVQSGVNWLEAAF